MRFLRNLLLILIICSFCSNHIIAQNSANTIDLRLKDVLRKELAPDSAQAEKLDKMVTEAAGKIAELEAEKMQVQRETEDEELLLTQLKVLNQEIKDVREVRDLDIQALLSPDQLKLYNEKIKPKKPTILHFGLHNRADCKVCTK